MLAVVRAHLEGRAGTMAVSLGRVCERVRVRAVQSGVSMSKPPTLKELWSKNRSNGCRGSSIVQGKESWPVLEQKCSEECSGRRRRRGSLARRETGG